MKKLVIVVTMIFAMVSLTSGVSATPKSALKRVNSVTDFGPSTGVQTQVQSQGAPNEKAQQDPLKSQREAQQKIEEQRKKDREAEELRQKADDARKKKKAEDEKKKKAEEEKRTPGTGTTGTGTGTTPAVPKD